MVMSYLTLNMWLACSTNALITVFANRAGKQFILLNWIFFNQTVNLLTPPIPPKETVDSTHHEEIT